MMGFFDLPSFLLLGFIGAGLTVLLLRQQAESRAHDQWVETLEILSDITAEGHALLVFTRRQLQHQSSPANADLVAEIDAYFSRWEHVTRQRGPIRRLVDKPSKK